jgi:hypothetical protein
LPATVLISKDKIGKMKIDAYIIFYDLNILESQCVKFALLGMLACYIAG